MSSRTLSLDELPITHISAETVDDSPSVSLRITHKSGGDDWRRVASQRASGKALRSQGAMDRQDSQSGYANAESACPCLPAPDIRRHGQRIGSPELRTSAYALSMAHTECKASLSLWDPSTQYPSLRFRASGSGTVPFS